MLLYEYEAPTGFAPKAERPVALEYRERIGSVSTKQQPVVCTLHAGMTSFDKVAASTYTYWYVLLLWCPALCTHSSMGPPTMNEKRLPGAYRVPYYRTAVRT